MHCIDVTGQILRNLLDCELLILLVVLIELVAQLRVSVLVNELLTQHIAVVGVVSDSLDRRIRNSESWILVLLCVLLEHPAQVQKQSLAVFLLPIVLDQLLKSVHVVSHVLEKLTLL